MKVLNPKQSPNTDGMDPESVDGLEVVGVYFSLGDDCIAMSPASSIWDINIRFHQEMLIFASAI